MTSDCRYCEVSPETPWRCNWFSACLAMALVLPSTAAATDAVEFARDVRPILSDNCFQCHGPDPGSREADLRLDVWEDSESMAASAVIEPRDADESILLTRIFSEEEWEQMPPSGSGKSLTAEQKEILRRWIEQGAEYQTHWAFVAPERPKIPEVANDSWVANPIDAFVLARLKENGLEPSSQADPLTLLRRLSLDLIGLPPTEEEIEKFRNDASYQKTVERLLSSSHFGERWGRWWLDAARYADSDGYEKDLPREVWMYRDWVIQALNADMPYDEFLIQQIAGDMLPQPTQDQIVATGFLRNSMVNREGGIDPEEFRMEGMYDRMDAIGKSILGLTVQCAQCHTHKYDPISHTEYYRMFAFLNNSHEAQPTVYTDEQLQQCRDIKQAMRKIETKLKQANPDWKEQLAAWEESVDLDDSEWKVVRPEVDASGGQKHYLLNDGSILAQGYTPPQLTSNFEVEVDVPVITAVRLELLNDPNLPRGGPGRSKIGLCALTEIRATAVPVNNSDKAIELEFAHATADVNPQPRKMERTADDGEKPDRLLGPVEMAIDGDDLTAWTIDRGPGRSNVPREAVFVLKEPLECDGPVRLKVTLVQKHGGRRITSPQNNNLGRFRLAVTSEENAAANPVPKRLRKILRTPLAERAERDLQSLFSYWRTTVDDWHNANQRIEKLWKDYPLGTSQLVMDEREDPRTTHRLERGSFLSPAEEVSPGVPEFLHPLEAESPDRLDFAQWLVDRRSPTTARALVNRIWQAYFGTGLVSTPGDFGVQGSSPTHPELLDWLAVELMESGWSQKHIHRLIVHSSTYRQSSKIPTDLVTRDPNNELLARGPRYRVDAEMVRDIALSASGLLNLKIGGPSVYPPAPEFLFEPPASFEPKTWFYDSEGKGQYRRALYTFRYRSVPHPAMETFDAPSGSVSCVRRTRSNTPMQALTTLNEPLFLDCARALATKTLAEGGRTDKSRLSYAFRRCLTRSPEAEELTLLTDFLDRQRSRFFQSDANAEQLVLAPGSLQNEIELETSIAEKAAWTAVARVLLNLDETITKQ